MCTIVTFHTIASALLSGCSSSLSSSCRCAGGALIICPLPKAQAYTPIAWANSGKRDNGELSEMGAPRLSVFGSVISSNFPDLYLYLHSCSDAILHRTIAIAIVSLAPLANSYIIAFIDVMEFRSGRWVHFPSASWPARRDLHLFAWPSAQPLSSPSVADR